MNRATCLGIFSECSRMAILGDLALLSSNKGTGQMWALSFQLCIPH